MRYILGIPFVNRPDLLRLAIQSVEPLWPHALIIDNSDTGLDTAMWPVPIVCPPVPLTLSQTMNLLQRLAAERSCDVLLFMHNDAEAGIGTPERLLAIVEEAITSEQRWGVVFTHYDTLAAFSMEMARVVGQWDTTLPQYFADGDYYLRVRLAGYEIINTGLQMIHHSNASSTLKSDPAAQVSEQCDVPTLRALLHRQMGRTAGERNVRLAVQRNDLHIIRQLSA